MDYQVWANMLLRRRLGQPWQPMKLLFVLDENNCAGLVYNHIHPRRYEGNFDFNDGRARGRIDLSGLDGMPTDGQVFHPLWNADDGKFYANLPLGAMPFETVLGFWADVPAGVKKGVYYGDGTEGPATFKKKITPFGLLKFSPDNRAFRFIAKTDTGWQWLGSGRISDGLPTQWLFVPDWHPNWHTRLYTDFREGYTKYTYQVFSFSADGASSEKVVCTPFTFKGAPMLQISPWYDVLDRQWCSAAQQSGTYYGTLRDDGKLMQGYYPYPAPWAFIAYPNPRLEKYRYVVSPYDSNFIVKETEATILFSSIDPTVSNVVQMDDGVLFSDARITTFADWAIFKMRCGQAGSYYVKIALLNHSNFTIAAVIDWREFAGYAEPGCVRVYNHVPYLVTCAVGDDKPLLVNMLTGSFLNWREGYRWNHTLEYWDTGVGTAWSWTRLPRTGADGTVAMEYWADFKEEDLWSVEPDKVLHGDVSVITPIEEMFVADASVQEVLDCQQGYYKARATFTVKTVFGNAPVDAALVYCRITASLDATTVYDQIFSAMTGADGKVSFQNPTCLYGGTDQQTFQIRFTVVDVVKAQHLYQPDANIVSEIVWTKPAAPPAAAFNPDPAEFVSGSPFQIALSGAYYHVMVAVAPQVNWTPQPGSYIEYRFECVDNPNFSSGWRNPDTVAGLFDPNGVPQAPERFWRNVGVKNLLYRWTVQYRRQNTAQTSQKSAAKQIGNTLP